MTSVSPSAFARLLPQQRHSARTALGLLSLGLLTMSCGCATTAQRNGKQLYAAHCAVCHEAKNLGLRKEPPRLKNLLASGLPSGTPATDQTMRKVIIEGRATMPGFDQRLNPREIEDLIAYLRTK